jgi:hypothetical protein
VRNCDCFVASLPRPAAWLFIPGLIAECSCVPNLPVCNPLVYKLNCSCFRNARPTLAQASLQIFDPCFQLVLWQGPIQLVLKFADSIIHLLFRHRGLVIHECDEPLDQHTGHGSAEPKKTVLDDVALLAYGATPVQNELGHKCKLSTVWHAKAAQ